jgi:hypothetical protein
MRILVAALLIGAAGCDGASPTAAPAPPAPAAPARGGDAIENEVANNVLAQPIGRLTLADLAPPEAFVRRIARRIVRDDYRDRTQYVMPPEPEGAAPATGGALAPSAGRRLVRAARGGDALAWWQEAAVERPEARGFAAPILGAATRRDPREPSARAEGAEALVDLVGRRLARDGIVATLAAARPLVGAAEGGPLSADAQAALRRAGFPVDLLEHFDDGGAFAFRPSRPDFRAAVESGDEEIGLVRLQLPRGDSWRDGDGGGLDVARQIVQAMPEARFLVAIEERFLGPFSSSSAQWPPIDMTVLPQPLEVAQWAQDNGKPGAITGAGAARPALLVPRYASRRDDGSEFVPGESLLVESIAAGGIEVVRSPLLFQGGNLMVVRDPASGRRILLAGEAEIHRNAALGLTAAQAEDALRAELGADEIVVLPSVSFHLDYDVSVRAAGGRLVAFVNDASAAAIEIVALAAARLEDAALLSAGAARPAIDRLRRGEDALLVELVGAAVAREASSPGVYPLAFARTFTAGPADSPAGNLQRVLTALDLLAAAAAPADDAAMHANLRAYLRALREIDADRRRLHEVLRSRGFEIVPIPSLAEGVRSVNYLNAIHDRRFVLMPAYGGFLAPLDEAARYEAALGPEVRVIPILCAESQRRNGAVRCAASVFPRHPEPPP